jgi:hypothetical protein
MMLIEIVVGVIIIFAAYLFLRWIAIGKKRRYMLNIIKNYQTTPMLTTPMMIEKLRERKVATKKSVTIRDFFDAMEKDTLPKAQSRLVIRDVNGSIVAACAYGQAALHLGVDPDALYAEVREFGRRWGIRALNDIVGTNDLTDSTVPAIARYYRSQVPWKWLDTVVAEVPVRS